MKIFVWNDWIGENKQNSQNTLEMLIFWVFLELIRKNQSIPRVGKYDKANC